VPGKWIDRAIWPDIPKEDRITGAGSDLLPRFQESCTSSFILIVEVADKTDHTRPKSIETMAAWAK
jgi:hypothetical protein